MSIVTIDDASDSGLARSPGSAFCCHPAAEPVARPTARPCSCSGPAAPGTGDAFGGRRRRLERSFSRSTANAGRVAAQAHCAFDANSTQGAHRAFDSHNPPDDLRGLDALAATLSLRLHGLARPLSRAADAFSRRHGWFELGYARAEDFARERLGRTGRWLRDLAALGRATLHSEELLDAMTGEDGGPPLGTVAALAIVRGTTDEFRSTWIALARAVGVRELKERLRRSRQADRPFPVDADGRRDDQFRPPDPVLAWVASACPALLTGPAFAEKAALPWNRRFLEALGIPVVLPDEVVAAEEAERRREEAAAADRRALFAWAEECFPGPGNEDGPDGDHHLPRATVRLDLPAPVVAAFHEVRLLHDRACGTPRSAADFVEALVAEARAAGLDPRPDLDGALARLRRTRVHDDVAREEHWDATRRAWFAMARAGDRRRTRAGEFVWLPDIGVRMFPPALDCPSPASECFPPAGLTHALDPEPSARSATVAAADALLARADRLFADAGSGSATELAARLRALVDIEQEIRRALGDVLAALARQRAWTALGYDSVRHYAEARLGMGRSTVEDLATLARALSDLPAVEEAHRAGRISSLAALRLVRILGRSGVPDDLQRDWVARAESATIKRLDDERDALRKLRLLAVDPSDRGPQPHPPPRPLPDADWHRSLRRLPGETTARIEKYAALAAAHSAAVAPLRLILSFDLAADFLGAVDAAARRVRTFSADLAPFDARWLGLYALLTSYVATHDARRGPRGVYARDGWRCMAPGCTSCAQLEDHHVLYRAHGGDDAPDNRVTLCRFHHQRGEHGGAMRVRGRAPLELDFELAGRRYRNELEVARPEELESPTS